MKVDLVIQNFPADTEVAEITDHLCALGLDVLACRIVEDRDRRRAVALVERAASVSTTAALVHGTIFRGQPLRATLANTRGIARQTQRGSALGLALVAGELAAILGSALL